ncbi:putative glycerol-3-phosphate dehydrogenase [NAD(+)] 1, cytosolic [Vitis vinifera]|uniref:Putative glycerol-3-phosphate dehydrogenase [NAD(+)] 1, cytosolic n=1 Tax=Vitis vinifera TaxID=29760 RepID=A0A438IUE5_VITVI|nr:putative glycerol-3-phosphate dehydrogenase [NAD(+)] 1, cytosolic [Vitis vinifera]
MQASLCRFFFFWLIFLPCLFISFLASIKNANTVFHLQGISAVKAFYELLSQSCLSILHSEENKPVAPVELCPILKTLYNILIAREASSQAILQALRDQTMNDPRDRIAMAQTHAFYRPSLLGQQP